MKTQIFYSGSKGNCTYVSDGETSILIDAGGCLKRIRENLNEVGDRLENVKGIFVTHEHSDHTKAIFNITKKYDCRIFTTVDTARAMCTPTATLSVDDCRRVARSVMTIKPEKTYEIGTFQIKPFSTPHDAADSIGFILESTVSGKSLAYATDIGHITKDMESLFLGIKNVILESNHDVEMLMNGPYPEYLKTRIISDVGHLSNASAGSFLRLLAENGAESVVLAHLSEENNTPALARECARKALEGFDVKLEVASPYRRVEMKIC